MKATLALLMLSIFIDTHAYAQFGLPKPALIQKINQKLLNNARIKLKNPAQLILLVGNYERSPFKKNEVWPREPKSVVDLVGFAQNFGNGVALYQYFRFFIDE